MSIDLRIARIAREELKRVLGDPPNGDSGDAAPTRQQLQQQITDLHEHLHQAATTIHRLEARLDELEKTTATADKAEAPAPRRAPRKRAET